MQHARSLLPAEPTQPLGSAEAAILPLPSDTSPYYRTANGALFQGDCIPWLESLPDASGDLVFADPPYNIKRAEWDSFESQERYVEWSMQWITQVARVLKPSGTVYICGFSEILADLKWTANPLFAGCKWLVWHYRNKANMGTDWGRSHESIIHFRKSRHYTFNVDPVRVPYNQHTLRYPDHPQAVTSQYGKGQQYIWSPNPLGAKPRDVLEIPTINNQTPEKMAHEAQKPEELLRRIVLASSNENDVVIDPFGGTGTTYVVCEQYGRRWLGCELSPEYCEAIVGRLRYPEQYRGDRSRMSEEALAQRRAGVRFGRQ